jgi:hypothetical protein
MRTLNDHRGMTMWSLLFVLGMIALVVFLILKLFPVYMADMKVNSALDSLVRTADVGSMSKSDISEALRKRFEIDNVDHIDLGKDMTITPRGRSRLIRIKYDAVVPMVGNISALMEFNHEREVRASGE